MNVIYLSFILRIIKITTVVLSSCFWFYIFFIHVLGLCTYINISWYVFIKGPIKYGEFKSEFLICTCAYIDLSIVGKFGLKWSIYCMYLEMLLPRSKNLCYTESCLTHKIISRLYVEFFWLSDS
jgi:hypothetical protein